jgi:hypothetical protein
MERPDEHHINSGNTFSVQWIAHLEKRNAELEAAARDVTCFDWSDNDQDAVRAVDALRKLVS